MEVVADLEAAGDLIHLAEGVELRVLEVEAGVTKILESFLLV